MKKEWIIFLAVVLVVSGCQGIAGNKQPDAKQAMFVGGTKGLEIAFATDQPPQSILDNSQETFPISLLVRNKGEYDIPVNNLIASLSGIVQSTFSLSSLNTKNSLILNGVKKEGDTTTPGFDDILEFGQASYKVDLPGETTYTIRADVCYNYQTKAVSKVCLKKAPLKIDKVGSVCQITNSNLGAENSGAPVHAENARESTAGTNKVKISFKISNKDVGAVFQTNTFTDSCVGHDDEKDQVKVTVYNPERNFNIECPLLSNSNTGIVKLISKEREVSCTIDTTSMQDITFQDLIIVQLDYMYRQAVIIPLRIRSEG